jgi:hypothetical protein
VDEGTGEFSGREFGTEAADGVVPVPDVAPGRYVDGGDVEGGEEGEGADGWYPDGPDDEESPRAPGGDAGATGVALYGATVGGAAW